MDTQILLIVLAVVLVATVGIFVVWRLRDASRQVGAGVGGLSKTSSALGAALHSAWGSGISDEMWEDIEEALLAADVGVEVSYAVVEAVRRSRPTDVDAARGELRRRLRAELLDKNRTLSLEGVPSVILVVGVNGTGKTTTIAKLARRLTDEGKSVVLAAADTFRAAAGTQLEVWGDRLDVDVIVGQDGGDPASVVFDALESARTRGIDVVIVDTAGRLHAKKNLMAELAKVHRVASGERGAVDEVLLVLDATGGQNGLAQVEEFSRTVQLTGIALTKLDGTAKGGIVLSIERTLGVPVKFIGLGESLDDLEPFDPDEFIVELLAQS